MTRSVRWLLIASALGGCVDGSGTSTATSSLFGAGSPRPAVDHTPQTWRPITTPIPTGVRPAVPQLMQDGTLVIQDYGTDHWWRYAPDAFGQYDDGTWTQLADSATDGTANGYAPLFDAQAVLPDGRMIVEGGEYISLQPVWTSEGAIYDPIADTWTAVAPPKPWTSETTFGSVLGGTIGDASGIVLPDGTFMLSNCCTPEMAKLDPATLTWTAAGQGKADENDEESWSVLFDGRIVTADADGGLTGDQTQHSEAYDPKTDTWSSLPDVPVELDQVNPSDPNNTTVSSHEVGPEMTRPDGTIVAIGGTPHNAVFDPSTMSWSALPDTPGGDATVDGPGATLPNGDVIFATGPPYDGNFEPGTKWYELHGTTFTQVGGTPDDPNLASFEHFLVVLPTGEILHTQDNYMNNTLMIYTPAPGVAANAMPQILGDPRLVGTSSEAPTAPVPTLYKGRSYTMPIARMNGISLGATYGDDVQTSTDFPIVRLTASGTGHVWYCRTYNPTDRSTSPDEQGVATFDVPASAEGGTATLSVIANGIASPAMSVNIK